MERQYRQGHILLHPLPKVANMVSAPLPPGAKFGTSGEVRSDAVVLATGETGREHIFKGLRTSIYQLGSDIFIEIKGDEPIVLEHPEHGEIEVEPGTYRLIEQREMGSEAAPRRSFD